MDNFLNDDIRVREMVDTDPKYMSPLIFWVDYKAKEIALVNSFVVKQMQWRIE